MSYPKGKTTVTCYTYEPWHYRYVGRAQAAALRASSLTLREYLWSSRTRPPRRRPRGQSVAVGQLRPPRRPPAP